jgi:pyrroloquinoline quinone biosynthesis protein B
LFGEAVRGAAFQPFCQYFIWKKSKKRTWFFYSSFMKNTLLFLILFCLSCDLPKKVNFKNGLSQQYIVVLGVAQDAGYPHPYCGKKCCDAVAQGLESKKRVTCLGLVDKATNQVFMLEATPDFTEQERLLRLHLSDKSQPINGILLTHAHIGHYTGLMYLGREAIGAKEMPVFAMPKMKVFFETNAPWTQLVKLKNIQIMPLAADSTIELSKNIHIKPIIVPHRDEFSETVGLS